MKPIRRAAVAVLVVLLAILFMGQSGTQPNLPDAPQPQNVPDAPSATRPAQGPPFPAGNSTAPPAQAPAKTSSQTGTQTAPPPSPPPASSAPPQTRGAGNSRDDLYTLRADVNFVIVPVTVKDQSGRLVEGLLRDDFTVLEEGNQVPVKFFTSDPFPLSAAVVIDLGMADTEVSKITKTLSSLEGAFSQFDEVAFYTYGNTVSRVQDFSAALSNRVTQTLRKMKGMKGKQGGVPVAGGPLHTSVPTINGKAVDPGRQPEINVPAQEHESRVLNDAMLMAALDLAKRERVRRKVLFVISDGREQGSDASYTQVLKVLLSNEISVYAVAVGGAAIPGYGKLQKIRIPGLGYGDILPKYASATGGQVFTQFSQKAIETAYARVTEEARNQYTLGYTTRATPSTQYRSIEVRVHRPGLKVFAKDGYYPLPAAPTP